jgi:hypothetical protein
MDSENNKEKKSSGPTARAVIFGPVMDRYDIPREKGAVMVTMMVTLKEFLPDYFVAEGFTNPLLENNARDLIKEIIRKTMLREFEILMSNRKAFQLVLDSISSSFDEQWPKIVEEIVGEYNNKRG